MPPGQPRTKPKALNYGLQSARGDIVAVFDAEDRPSPQQPREAVAAFHSGPSNLAVVQAPLLVHNGTESWFARHFEVEYAILFRVWLPFLARLGTPLPLGGTSNYFRADFLRAVGGWDAWNVTEDADLGLRLARFGGKAATIISPTWEEAPVHFRDWLAQRTRWTKGHLQTWLVLMRRPLTAAMQMGWINFASVQLTLGGSLLTSAMHTPLLVWLVLGLFTPFVGYGRRDRCGNCRKAEGSSAKDAPYAAALSAAIVARYVERSDTDEYSTAFLGQDATWPSGAPSR